MTDENGKYNYAKAVHPYPPFFDISCSAKNYKIASALTLRAYLVGKDGSSERFAQTIPAADVITPEAFREYADEMRQGVGEVTAALDIDLDRATFSTMAGADGWQTYTVSDVLAAAWNATIPHWSDWEARRCVFAEQLEDKLIDQESTGITPPTGPTM